MKTRKNNRYAHIHKNLPYGALTLLAKIRGVPVSSIRRIFVDTGIDGLCIIPIAEKMAAIHRWNSLYSQQEKTINWWDGYEEFINDLRIKKGVPNDTPSKVQNQT